MRTLDWCLALIPLLLALAVGFISRRYMKSVADFMSGGRVAGPYLLAVSRGEIEAGAATFVAMFEIMRLSGFTLSWWGWISVPVAIVTSISGFVVYRYRETRAMTLAQFFELRYNKEFRVFTGLLGFVAGILNFGIIPAVGSRFLVYFLGLPPIILIGSWSLPTYIPLMGGLLFVTVCLALSGGLITVMVSNCLEGIFSQLFYIVIIVALLVTFSWTEITEVLGNRPPGQSLLNPFDASGIADFNLWYVLMSLFVGIYGTMAWQNSSAYNGAAITPHASVMGGVLSRWRELGKVSVITLLAICAMTYLDHPDFSEASAAAKETIAGIPETQVQKQMEIPIALSYLLPLGVKGLFCAIILMGIFGGDSTHLHSWGSIFVQDVLVPLRKKAFGPDQHIRILRRSIVGVAVFVFLFGSLFQQTEYIMMWFQVTTAIYVGGAGAAIIGGLYWNRGTSAGAWTALLTGSSLSVGGILARQIFGDAFPLNGVQISCGATVLAIAMYVVVSLLTCRKVFNMDRMLHRGPYAAVIEMVGEQVEPPEAPARKKSWGKLIGIDEGFSTKDRWVAGGLFWWSMFWFAIFLVVSVWNLFFPWPESTWSSYWHLAGVGIPVILSLGVGVWFSWGGAKDIFFLFKRLGERKVNHLDDGTVVGHQNLDETVLPQGNSAMEKGIRK